MSKKFETRQRKHFALPRAGEGGFLKVELLVTLAIVSLSIVLATPYLRKTGQNLSYRQAAREVLAALREARSLTVSQYREYRVEFNVSGNRFRIVRGDQPSGSSNWSYVVRDWISFPHGVVMRRNKKCDGKTDAAIHFNPNGTANSLYICVMDQDNRKRYMVGVADSVTARVKVEN